MFGKRSQFSRVPLVVGVVAGVLAPAGPAAAADYGQYTCVQGYVWREAGPGDYVCVTPETRAQAAADNSQAAARRSPTGGDYGPNTCLPGYVWRDAVAADYVCVTPETRAQAAADNSQAAGRWYYNTLAACDFPAGMQWSVNTGGADGLDVVGDDTTNLDVVARGDNVHQGSQAGMAGVGSAFGYTAVFPFRAVGVADFACTLRGQAKNCTNGSCGPVLPERYEYACMDSRSKRLLTTGRAC